jgi:hypothetical protein
MLGHEFRHSKTTEGVLRRFGLASLVISALALLAPGCTQDVEHVGFGVYQIGKSTPKDGYACRPQDEQTYCSNNPSPKIAGHKTQTDLFFRGHEENAPLVEILVGVWNCRPGDVGADLQGKVGKPTQVGDKRALWKLKKMTVVALLPRPDDKTLCTVHFLDHSETERIAELFPETTEAPAQ